MSLSSRARDLVRAAVQGRTLRRRLPRSVGGAVVFVAPASQLKYLRPGVSGLDGELIGWARRHVRPGTVVWDVGANCGVFAMAAAGLGARVLAVEPDPFLAHSLMRARAANPALDIEILAAAIDDKQGVATLEIAGGGRASNALAAYAGNYLPFGKSAGRILVPTLQLDDLLTICVPTLVKIDIEGAEIAALRGASRLLGDARPTILMEIASEVWSEGVEILAGAGYRVCDPDHPEREVREPMFNILAQPI